MTKSSDKQNSTEFNQARNYSSKSLIKLVNYIGDSWRDVANYFEISDVKRRGFQAGREIEDIWLCLEQIRRLDEIEEAFKAINRTDLIQYLIDTPPNREGNKYVPKIFLPDPFDKDTFDEEIQFTGRDYEKEQLKQWLIDQENGQKVVVISGTSGIGKSALACEFALQNQEKFFPDGIYGVRVNEKRYTNNEDFLETIARDLLSQQGIRLDKDEIRNGQPIIQKMKDEFAKIQALIIFDNVETMTINRLFPSGKCSIIVTTINHRFFQASSQYKNIDLLLPNQVESQENERLVNESLELLKKLVGENRRQEINQNESIAREILNLIAYLPLAVKIISISLEGTFENDSLNDFLNSLRSERSRLVHCKPEREQKNLDVWYSFALAFQGLSEEIEKEIFVRLGACAQTRFSIRLISAITGFEEKDAITYLKRLEKNILSRKSKLTKTKFTLYQYTTLFMTLQDFY